MLWCQEASKNNAQFSEFLIIIFYCIAIFDAGQVYVKIQVTNFKNKEFTANPKLKTLQHPKPLILNPKS